MLQQPSPAQDRIEIAMEGMKPSDALDFSDDDALEVPSTELTAAQHKILEKLFANAQEDPSVPDLAVEQVEGMCAQVFEDSVTDQMLDVIIDMIEGHDRVNLSQFKTLISQLLSLTTNWGILKTQKSGYVGFDTIGTQINKKMLKRGYEFNIMVVGSSGSGKSTFVDSLFRSRVSRKAGNGGTYAIPDCTTKVETVSHVIEENGVRLKLSITDTPGFNDQIDNSDCWKPVLEYITHQYEIYLDAELAVKRPANIPDRRVHCLLYFIQPSGHGLTALDLAALSALSPIVNVVPVIAKADSLTLDEREAFRQRVREDLEQCSIKVYPGAPTEEEDDEELALNEAIRATVPYAVVGSNGEAGGKLIRSTKFGTVQVEDPNHCEFTQLRDMLMRTNLQDLKERTAQVQYESYRQNRLAGAEADSAESIA